jgi:hypothetical protein
MRRVEYDYIKNEHIHSFFGVADIIDEIRLRQFHWLGKLARQPDSLPTKRLLSAWAQAARRGGAQFITLRTTYCDTLESIIGEDCMKSGSGTLKEWFSLAQSPAKWPNCWPRLRDSAASHATINIQTKRYGNTHVKEQQFMRTKVVQRYTN